jgi:hypothetical protein
LDFGHVENDPLAGNGLGLHVEGHQANARDADQVIGALDLAAERGRLGEP